MLSWLKKLVRRKLSKGTAGTPPPRLTPPPHLAAADGTCLTPCSPRAGATPSRCSRRRTFRPRGCTSSTPRRALHLSCISAVLSTDLSAAPRLHLGCTSAATDPQVRPAGRAAPAQGGEGRRLGARARLLPLRHNTSARTSLPGRLLTEL